MTFKERHKLIDDAWNQYRTLHLRFTTGIKVLSDEEWKNYINSMDAIREMYIDSPIADLSGKLCQAFLDDTEYVQKRLKERG